MDVVANLLSCVCGSPTLEKGCPILGLCRDADSCARPSVPWACPPSAPTAAPAASTSAPRSTATTSRDADPVLACNAEENKITK